MAESQNQESAPARGRRECPIDFRCMADLSVEEVYRATLEFVQHWSITHDDSAWVNAFHGGLGPAQSELSSAVHASVPMPKIYILSTPHRAGTKSQRRVRPHSFAKNAEFHSAPAGHCAQPILRRFGHETTVRATLAMYNTCEDVDALVSALHRIRAGSGSRGIER